MFVGIEGANGLIAADRGGVSDPYAKLKLDGREYKTKTLHKTINPVWGEEKVWKGKNDVDKPWNGIFAKPLHIKIFDDDVLSRDDKLGECDVDLGPLINQLQEGEESWHTVKLDTQGTVDLSLKWIWCEALIQAIAPLVAHVPSP